MVIVPPHALGGAELAPVVVAAGDAGAALLGPVSIVVLAASGASYTDIIALCNVRILREYCSIGR